MRLPFQEDRLHGSATTISQEKKKEEEEKIEKAIITTQPSLSEAFIPLPSLPAMTPICLLAHLPCGSSKNGSQMCVFCFFGGEGGSSDAVIEIQYTSEDFYATQYS